METVNNLPDAIILAGGMGTRLRSVIQNVPKPMAPIGDTPFLSYLLDELKQQGVQKVVLSTGYKHEIVEQHYGDSYKGMQLVYSVEDSPLGTGGAIKKALRLVNSPNALILNGDTMFRVDLQGMYRFHQENESDLTLALKKMEDSQRYGVVETTSNRVVRFREKAEKKAGSINGGVYLLRKDLLLEKDFPEKFSFEKDFMEAYFRDFKVMAFVSDGYFIDIGIPEDYARAQQELSVIQ
ncbi:nucleotidyltransferase family protein [Nafulsella turpanensis]|uniref:nucleotidyltransferase family protein n=1 Tax=Nafulsella turpanensis TaxID=1265690 RepID=UPI0003477D30|nr:nucleotidyltransferase family protein [Nafulsella turpanensis]